MFHVFGTPLAVLALVAGCGSAPTPTLNPAPRSPFDTTFDSSRAPTIRSFATVPSTIALGESATLEWDVDDPTASLTIDNGVGGVFGTRKVVSPSITTTYTLYASNGAGSPSQSVTVVVAGSTTQGASTSTTAVNIEQWRPATENLAGLSSECGNMSFVSADPYADRIVAGIALQGLWSDGPGEESFTKLGGGALSATISNRTSSIVYDPEVPGRFWQSGIYNGAGVFETVDDGVTFQQLGNVEHSDNVSVDFTDPLRLTLLSGRHETSTLFRSQDAGSSWQDISATLPADIGYATSPYVINATTYLLGTNNGPASGVYYTDNGGLSWRRTFDAAISGRPIVSVSDGALYWLLDFGSGLIRSDDLGVTWTVVESTAPFARSPGSLVQLPGGALAALGDAAVLVSSDLGITWDSVGEAFPYAPNGLTYAPIREQFYIWKFDCVVGTNPIPANAIMTINYP